MKEISETYDEKIEILDKEIEFKQENFSNNLIREKDLLFILKRKREKLIEDKKFIIKQISEMYDENIKILDEKIKFNERNIEYTLIKEKELKERIS